MPAKDIYRLPFDDGTIVKLDVLREYFKEWLPVFVSRKEIIWETIQIFDFFAGQGRDENGEAGSATILIEVVKSLEYLILKSKVKILIHLNEKSTTNFQILKKNLNTLHAGFEIKFYNADFQDLFVQLYPTMDKSANFIFFDQNGIKEITKEVFSKVLALKKTDFLFFISSSYFKRFAATPEFKKYFPFDPSYVADTDYYHIHRKVLEYYKSLIPENKKYYLAPFSIKKQNNIYGLIFGTNHTLGIEKFLSVSWKKDRLRGEANYDIDNEKINHYAPSLFEEFNKPSKRNVFENNLKAKILDCTLKDIRAVYLHTIDEGFLYRDANSVLEKLVKEKKIIFDYKLIIESLHKQQDVGIIIVL